MYSGISINLFGCVADYDGLALGYQFMGFFPVYYRICENIWPRSESSDSERNMEGIH